MKIEELLPGIAPGQKTDASKSKESSGISFAAELQLRLQALTSKTILGPTEASLAQGVGGIPVEARLSGLSLTEETLNLLEAYGEALGDLNKKIEDLEPFVSTLEDRTMALKEIVNKLPPGDPLADLLDKVAAETLVQTVKFRRGDFHA